MSTMTNNRVGVAEPAVVSSNTTPLRTPCDHCRRRKVIYIVFSFIIVAVIITISVIALKTNKTNSNNAATMIITEQFTVTAPTTEVTETIATTVHIFPPVVININTEWEQDASTVAGGNGSGGELSQLNSPLGIYVDDDKQCIYIADFWNHRILKSKFGADKGEVVAGGNGEGNETNQLSLPTDVIIDKNNKNDLIICDQGNGRLVRRSLNSDIYPIIMLPGISCWGLAMDNSGYIYIAHARLHKVTRWKQGETNEVIAAGGNGEGNSVKHLKYPEYIFVDRNSSVYVSDAANQRVMKWRKDAEEGFLVAGGQGTGGKLGQLSLPKMVVVDYTGNIYVSDTNNNRIVRWSPEAKEGSRVVGGNGYGSEANQLSGAAGLSFDQQGNLYVADLYNHRIQKFAIKGN